MYEFLRPNYRNVLLEPLVFLQLKCCKVLTFILWTSEVHTSFSTSKLIKIIELVNDDPEQKRQKDGRHATTSTAQSYSQVERQKASQFQFGSVEILIITMGDSKKFNSFGMERMKQKDEEARLERMNTKQRKGTPTVRK